MQNSLSRYIMIARRWAWIIILGVVICSSVTFVVSKLTRPAYLATINLLISFQSSNSAYDNNNAALVALPTYSQIITTPDVLQPVLAKHHGIGLQQLISMITVKPQSNTQIIELDVENSNPKLAMELANDIAQSFRQYATTQLPATVSPLSSAQLPTSPVKPKTLQNTLIGGLVGLGLALTLIVIFEWFDDRPASLEEVQELLGSETLAIIPHLSRKQRLQNPERTPALIEGSRMLYTNMVTAQFNKPFKLLMITSALDGEGKSTIAANLAIFLAMTGKRILLVDADLRRPAQYRHFHLDNSKGLSHILQGSNAPLEIPRNIQDTDIQTLQVLTAGASASNSVELLQSIQANQLFDYFKKAPYDYILFDSPPLLPVADTQYLASRIPATMLVVDASKTPRKVLVRAKNVFQRTRTTLLGAVINKSPWLEYGYIRQYQRDILQTYSEQKLLPPPNTPSPSVEKIEDTVIPTTPPVDKVDTMALPPHPIDEIVDPNMTMTHPYPIRPKKQYEKEK